MKTIKILACVLMLAGACFAQGQQPANWFFPGNPSQPITMVTEGVGIAKAISDAGPFGVVWIPASYQGSDCVPVSSCNGGGQLVIDLRNGKFAPSNLANIATGTNGQLVGYTGTGTLGPVTTMPTNIAGAKPDEIRGSDGAMVQMVNGTTGTAGSTQAYTTNYANELVLDIYSWIDGTGADFSVAPSGVSVVSLAPAASKYAALAVKNLRASPQAVAASTGTYGASVKWNSGRLALIPTAGNAVGNRTSTTVQNASGAGLTAVVNKPTGTVQGDFVVVCAGWQTAGGNTHWRRRTNGRIR